MDVDSEHVWQEAAAGSPAAESTTWWRAPGSRRRPLGFVLYSLCLTIVFIKPLAGLVMYAAQSDLHSHVIVMPFIVGYLLIRDHRSQGTYVTAFAWSAALVAVGLAVLAAEVAGRGSLSLNDDHALFALAFVSLIAAGGFLFFGSAWMAAQALPMSLLIFMVPMPDAMRHWLENGSLTASADVASWLFRAIGMPFVREQEIFALPGIELHIARECSGIHSSWVLFITSLLAAHRTLGSPWRRAVLVAFVIPLGIVRNGIRVVVIAALCVYIGPEMVDSPIHRQGGPLFFALSLIPLFLLLHTLRRHERPR